MIIGEEFLCDVCLFPTEKLFQAMSRFGNWVTDRCVHCHALDAHPLQDMEAIEDRHGKDWLDHELTYVQNPRSKGGMYVYFRDL